MENIKKQYTKAITKRAFYESITTSLEQDICIKTQEYIINKYGTHRIRIGDSTYEFYCVEAKINSDIESCIIPLIGIDILFTLVHPILSTTNKRLLNNMKNKFENGGCIYQFNYMKKVDVVLYIEFNYEFSIDKLVSKNINLDFSNDNK